MFKTSKVPLYFSLLLFKKNFRINLPSNTVPNGVFQMYQRATTHPLAHILCYYNENYIIHAFIQSKMFVEPGIYIRYYSVCWWFSNNQAMNHLFPLMLFCCCSFAIITFYVCVYVYLMSFGRCSKTLK